MDYVMRLDRDQYLEGVHFGGKVSGVQDAQRRLRELGPGILYAAFKTGPFDLVPADDPTGPARWRISVRQAVRPEGRPVGVQDFVFTTEDLSL
jgi:hypothetical protein